MTDRELMMGSEAVKSLHVVVHHMTPYKCDVVEFYHSFDDFVRFE